MKRVIGMLICLFSVANIWAQDADAGKAIFGQRCTSCHAVGRQVVGPDLRDVDKARSTQWIINFVHNSQAVIASGDTGAVNLFNEYNKTVMPTHTDLSEADIKNIIAFIQKESQELKDHPVQDVHVPGLGSIYGDEKSNSLIHKFIFLDQNGSYRPMDMHHYFFWSVLTISIVFIIIAMLKLVNVLSIVDKKDQNDSKK